MRARFCKASIDNRQTGPDIPMAPITCPLKLRTGSAAQRSSESNSPSSTAKPARRTSAISCASCSAEVIDFGVYALSSARCR